MAEVTWSRPPAETPPATFTLTLSEDEALQILGAIGAIPGTAPDYYPLFKVLSQALEAASPGYDYRNDSRYVAARESVQRIRYRP